MATASNAPLRPAYKQHTAVDDDAGVVVDIDIVTGEEHDAARVIDRLDAIADTLEQPVKRVTADAAYGIARVYAGLEARKIDHVIPHRTPIRRRDACPLRASCLPRAARTRRVHIAKNHPAMLRARRKRRRWGERERALYTRHRWRVEGAQGTAKTLHGLDRAVRRGLANVIIQALLTAVAMDLKKLAGAMLNLLATVRRNSRAAQTPTLA